MTSPWLSSRLRASSSLVLSIHAGDPRVLSPAVLSVYLLSRKHIHRMVSAIIPDLSVQWTLLSRAGHPISTLTKAPQTHDDTTVLQIRKHEPPRIPLPYSNHFKSNTKNWLFFFFLLSSGFITTSPLVLTAVDLGLFLDLFSLDYYNHGFRTELPHESPPSHPLT